MEVYAQAQYTDTDLEVHVFANIVDTRLVSFGLNLGYDEADLSVIAAHKNERAWYFADATTRFPYVDPYISTAGSVVIVGGKLDIAEPDAGVTGNDVLLGSVYFSRESASIPSLSLSLGIADPYANFVASDGTVLDQSPSQLIFDPVTAVHKEHCPDGTNKVIGNWTYSSGQFRCTAASSITAGSTVLGPVIVGASADVAYEAPIIRFEPSFEVAPDGTFRASSVAAP